MNVGFRKLAISDTVCDRESGPPTVTGHLISVPKIGGLYDIHLYLIT